MWVVDLICCGRYEGSEEFTTWEAADAFRESYCTGPGVGPNGHDRAGILRRPVAVERVCARCSTAEPRRQEASGG